MVMQTKTSLSPITKVEDGVDLPFQLTILVGEGWHEQEIAITQLTTLTHRIHQYMYEIEELKKLRIRLNGSIEHEVHMVWGTVQTDEADDPVFAMTLKEENIEQTLFPKKDEQYPWRCGTYHFEVIYQEKRYFGGFKITPKNVDDQQLAEIHDLINTELEGLTIDYVSQKQTYGTLSEIEESSYWRFIQWYFENEKVLFNSLRMIENNTQNELSRKYVIENIPKHIDHRSIKWQNTAKGQVYKDSRYLNRKLILHWDSQPNRLVKYRMSYLIKKLSTVINFLSNIKNESEIELTQVNDDIKKLEKSQTIAQNSHLTTDREKKRIKNTLITKRKESEKIKDRYKRITDVFTNLETSHGLITNYIHSGFWAIVSNKLPSSIVIGKHVGYQVFNKLWMDSSGMTLDDSVKTVTLPVYKPSFELYEYYVFFGIIHVFRELDFKTYEESIAQQLTRTFFEDGLKDGSQVTLVRDTLKVDIIYDEMVEHDADLAYEKGKNFYSRGSHRKPDLRLDLYYMSEDTWYYSSTFVIEVKYSPIYNIYTTHGKTRAMDQLSEYWSIMYVYSKGVYNHNAVQKVICIYPGAKKRSVKFNSEDGVFLQFYPNPESTDIYNIVGKDELKTMVNKWIESV